MKGLIEIFYEPGKVFDLVREKRAWVAPFVAGLLLFVMVFWYATESIGASNIVRHQLDESKLASQMPPDAKEKAIADADSSGAKARTLGFSAVGFGIIMVIFALLFMAIGAVSGGPIKFAQALGTVAYSSWPVSVVRSLLSVVVIMLAADKADLDPQHLLFFNAGAIFDKATTAKPLYTFASAIDLFVIAQILLAAYGLSRVARVSFSKSLTGMILIWVIFTLIAVGFSFIF